MAKGDVMFAGTGVTGGAMLKRRAPLRQAGPSRIPLVMRSKSGTVRYIEAHHNFETKTWQPEVADRPA